MKKKKDKETSGKDEGSGPEAQFTALIFDYEEYAPYLEDSDLTEEQKREFLETLWSIMVSFVDLGFGIHPVQQASGQDWSIEDLKELDLGDVVHSGHQHSKSTTFKAADHGQNDRTKGKDS